MSELVLVTQTEFKKGEAVFRAAEGVRMEPAPHDERGLADAVRARKCRAVIVGVQRYRKELYESLAAVAGGRPALIARFGVGHDSVDKAEARRLGILVTNTPGALDTGVAEHAMWLIGNLVRHVGRLDSLFHAGEYAPQTGSELNGRVLAVIGFGAIGRRVATAARFGFGMRVVAVGARPKKSLAQGSLHPDGFLAKHGADRYTTDWNDALAEADVVSLHLPITPATRHIVNAELLARMKPGSLLVNTARGGIVDEAALFDALTSGRLAGAALDVFENEPYVPVLPDKDLRKLPNTVLTPHVGSNTLESNERMARSCVEAVSRFIADDVARLPLVEMAP